MSCAVLATRAVPYRELVLDGLGGDAVELVVQTVLARAGLELMRREDATSSIYRFRRDALVLGCSYVLWSRERGLMTCVNYQAQQATARLHGAKAILRLRTDVSFPAQQRLSSDAELTATAAPASRASGRMEVVRLVRIRLRS